MSETIHIFRKDARHLWLQIAAVLAVTAAFAILQVLWDPFQTAENFRIDLAAQFTFVLLPLAWWFAIASLIHDESLPGDRQFWITRPYRRSRLAAAKLLFIVVFINMPLLLANMYILAAQHFSVVDNLPDLLWRQIPTSLYLILPMAAIATMTTGLGQFVFALFLIALQLIVQSLLFHSPQSNSGLEWMDRLIGDCVLALVGGFLIWQQYRARRTILARSVAAAFLVVPGIALPLDWTLATQRKLFPPKSDVSRISFHFDPALGRYPKIRTDLARDTRYVMLPVRVEGLAENQLITSTLTDATMSRNGKVIWRQKGSAALVQRRGVGYWTQLFIETSLAQSLSNKPVDLQVPMVVTLLRSETVARIHAGAASVRIPQFGTCRFTPSASPGDEQANCLADLQYPEREAMDASCAPDANPRCLIQWQLAVAPRFIGSWGLSPVSKWVLGIPASKSAEQDPEIGFVAQHPLAIFRKEFRIGSISLQDYSEIGPPAE